VADQNFPLVWKNTIEFHSKLFSYRAKILINPAHFNGDFHTIRELSWFPEVLSLGLSPLAGDRISSAPGGRAPLVPGSPTSPTSPLTTPLPHIYVSHGQLNLCIASSARLCVWLCGCGCVGSIDLWPTHTQHTQHTQHTPNNNCQLMKERDRLSGKTKKTACDRLQQYLFILDTIINYFSSSVCANNQTN